jgi:hypothetical protein
MNDTSVVARIIMFCIFIGIPLISLIIIICIENYREKKQRDELWHKMWDPKQKELERMEAEWDLMVKERKG